MRLALSGLIFLVISGCTCRPGVTQIGASLAVAPTGLDFGQVKTGQTAKAMVTLSSQSRAAVTISSVTLEGAEGFALTGTTPATLDPLGDALLGVTFAPSLLQAYTGTVVIRSNDVEHPLIRVALAGEGAKPIIEVTPVCERSMKCTGTVVVMPPAIDFGLKPFAQLNPLDPLTLPTVNIVNAGPVALTVSRAAFEGADGAAFSLAGNSMFPSEGLTLEPSEGRSLQLQFKPTSESKTAYAGQLVIESDDTERPRITIALSGTLAPNQAPVVCANLVRAVPPVTGDGSRDYASAAQWNELLTPPAGGYDFTRTRDVRPGDLAVFSALSNSSELSACTSDPEDARTGLTYAWRFTSVPAGVAAPAISGAATPQAQLRPAATGLYTLELSVKDVQLRETVVQMRFAVAIKQDLVAQLQWAGFADVDLDLHLVRPSAEPFSFFTAGAASKTSGDLNGYAANVVRTMPGSGFNLDWGQQGSADDPILNLDDTGSGPLIENVSLNFPENDAACAAAACRYGVYVHFFKDGRTPAPAGCFVDGGTDCRDGEACSCPAVQRCVADASPIGDAGAGVGKCFAAPQPVVKLYFRGAVEPANVIPLDTLVPPDALVIGAPCQLLHVADIDWPSKAAIGSLPDGGTPPPLITVPGADGAGRIVTPELTRSGYRQAGGSLTCSPDVTEAQVPWYSPQPR